MLRLLPAAALTTCALSLYRLPPVHAAPPPTSPPKTFVMVAMDMDGSLLNSQHELSDESVQTLRAVAATGCQVCLATGRSAPAVYAHVKKLALPQVLPVVCFNGASVRLFPPAPDDPRAEQLVLSETPLAASAVDQVLDLGNRLGVLAQYYVGDDIYVVCTRPEHHDLVKRYQQLTGATHVHVTSYDEAKAAGLPYKVLLMTDDPDAVVAEARAFMAAHCRPGDEPWTVIRGSPPFFVEFLNPTVNKGEGLLKLCEELAIDPRAVVGFGDGDNDREFLFNCGLGFAMKNARDAVKASLKPGDRITTLTNDDDGVAYELRKLKAAGKLTR